MKPYLFLDVDGVLNALDGLNKGDWDDFKKVKVEAPLGGVYGIGGYRFTMRFSKTMCAALAALDVEIHWATTWEHLANENLWRHTGLNDYPVACRMATGMTHGIATGEEIWWKWVQIRKMLEVDPRPMIWCDDEAIPAHAHEWLEANGVAHLLIAPDEKVGLTRDHLRRCREFIAMYG